ncbi:unnamed protein product [Protopolystoma xenopodis]|uniref:Uncharacterized protein n=1 Tax=Protopolystoma xenopodis TaxID=117903 RepID=A0A448WXT9_9PLAT|nr:unnamed protein product [Protopolystoma xenopodis]
MSEVRYHKWLSRPPAQPPTHTIARARTREWLRLDSASNTAHTSQSELLSHSESTSVSRLPNATLRLCQSRAQRHLQLHASTVSKVGTDQAVSHDHETTSVNPLGSLLVSSSAFSPPISQSSSEQSPKSVNPRSVGLIASDNEVTFS